MARKKRLSGLVRNLNKEFGETCDLVKAARLYTAGNPKQFKKYLMAIKCSCEEKERRARQGRNKGQEELMLETLQKVDIALRRAYS
jgi:hypothetical protein